MSIPLATAIGFVAALIVAVALTATAGTGKSGKSHQRALGGPLTVLGAGLVYLVVLLPLFTNPGLTWWRLVLLLLAVLLPVVVAAASQGMPAKFAGTTRTFVDLVGVVTTFVLLVGQLAAAGAMLSLFGGVNPSLATAALGLCCAAYLLGSGRTGSIRTSRYAVLALVLAVIVFGAGVVLGSAATVIAPLVPAQPLAPGAVVAALLAVAALGVFDPNTRSAVAAAARPRRAMTVGLVLTLITVVLFGIGGIMVFGGVLQAPNLEIMTVFAVLPPAGILVVMMMITFILASNVDSLLSAGAAAAAGSGARPRSLGLRPATLLLAVVAVVGAIVVPDPLLYLAAGAVVAGSGLGALLPAWRHPQVPARPWPAFAVGVITGIVLTVVLGPADVASLTSDTVIVLMASTVLAAGVSMLSERSKPPARPELVPASGNAGS